MKVLFYFMLSTIEVLLMTFGMLIANEEDGRVFKKVLTGVVTVCLIILFAEYSLKYKTGSVH